METYTRTNGGVDFRVRIDTNDFDNEVVEVDVKSSPADDPQLIVSEPNLRRSVGSDHADDPQLIVSEGKVDADYCVQCKIPQDALETEEQVTIEMLGGATKEMVLSREPIQSLNHDDSYHAINARYLLELPPLRMFIPLSRKSSLSKVHRNWSVGTNVKSTPSGVLLKAENVIRLWSVFVQSL